MGCAQSTRVEEVQVSAVLTPHEKLLARNAELAEVEQMATPSSTAGRNMDGTAGAERGASPGPHCSPNSVAGPLSLADAPDSPIVPSWRTGPDADVVYKAGTLSLYTHDTGTWESAFFELAQWSEDGRFCLRYKRFRGDKRWRQCWRLSSSTEIRRGAQRSILSMRERMSDTCPSGVVTVTALDPRDKRGLGSGDSREDMLDEVLVGTRYELTINEWADRIGELVRQASPSKDDAADEKRPASPLAVSLAGDSDADGSAGMAKLPNSTTPVRAAMRNIGSIMTVEDLSMVSPTSPISPVLSYGGDFSSSAAHAPPLVSPPVSVSASSSPVPAPLPPAPPRRIDEGGLAMQSGVAARRRAMGGGLNPEREWGPRDRDFDPFADKVSQTNASLASALAELGGLPSSDGRVYGVGGKVILPVMGNLGVDPDTSDDEVLSVGSESSNSDNDGWPGKSSGNASGIAPGRSAALAKRRSGGQRAQVVGDVDGNSARARQRNDGRNWEDGGNGRANRGQHSDRSLAVELPALPISTSSHSSLSSFPKIT